MKQWVILTAFLLVALAAPSSTKANPRKAQCLLEVKGVHYLGGPCVFIPIDRPGSFRIIDVRGLNLFAQINATKRGEGIALWNGPLGGREALAHELGDAYQAGACWFLSDASPNSYDDSRICAWTLSEKVYLGPSPHTPAPSSIVYYGSRVGMYDDIVSSENIDSANARIVTKASRDGAITYCRDYSHDYSLECIQLRDSRPRVIEANCQEKTFVDFGGNHFAFLGKVTAQDSDVMAEYAIRDLATGEILAGDMASGYEVELGIYQALCPSSAPRSE